MIFSIILGVEGLIFLGETGFSVIIFKMVEPTVPPSNGNFFVNISYGAMMYEIFTKKLPFDGGTVGSTILKIMTENPVSPRKINPSTPKMIENIIIKYLQKNQ